MTYLLPQEILYIHNRLVDELGGTHGTENLSVLKRAVSYIHNNEVFPDLISKASGLLFALSKKKPFKDLGQVTALSTTKLFLELNKKELDLEDIEVTQFIKHQLSKATLDDIKSFLTLKIR